jgi:hypothetical protein
MAMQRMTVATIAGEAGEVVAGLFRKWRVPQADGGLEEAGRAVDMFAEQLRVNGSFLPVLYFCEWFDHWLMGDSIHGSEIVSGGRFEASCRSRAEAVDWADRCGSQFSEQQWLAARLREASEAWQSLAGPAVIVVLRVVLGASATDQEVTDSLRGLPGWLSTGRLLG